MRALIHRWGSERVGWLLFKVVLGFGWTHAMFFVTPRSIASALSTESIHVWTASTAIGAAVSIVGLAMTTSENVRRRVRGYSTEIVGVVFLAGGPVQYVGVQVGFFGDPEEFLNRYALFYFALAMVCAIAVRLVQIVKHRRRDVSILTLQREV